VNLKYLLILAGFLSALSVAAQQPAKSKKLTDAQLEGKGRFSQRCSVCHSLTGRSYGPTLSTDVVTDHEDTVRQYIEQGSDKMPGFKYALKPEWIDQIIAYLKTVENPAGRANNLDLPD